MKSLSKIVVGILVCVVLLLLCCASRLEPTWNPGLWLKREPRHHPVTDWSYTDKLWTDMLQTNTRTCFLTR